MSKIFNYEKKETLATGFVRPKVTALFFDKIWIPESLLNSYIDFFAIPKKVLIQEKSEVKLSLSSKMKIGELYSIHMLANSPESFQFPPIPNSMNFKFSTNRNYAILVGSENFSRKYGIQITPVFHNFTEFEKELESLNPKELYKNSSLNFKFKQANTYLNKEALSICIQDFPQIQEDELSWEQVLDIRDDKKRISQLRKFTTWTNRTFTNETPEEIRNIIESELDEYKKAIKEHGIKTTLGTFSTIVSSASSIASILSNSQNLILPFLSITAITLNFSANTYFSSLKNHNNPIAYLYNLQK